MGTKRHYRTPDLIEIGTVLSVISATRVSSRLVSAKYDVRVTFVIAERANALLAPGDES